MAARFALLLLVALPTHASAQGTTDRGRLAEQTVDPISSLIQVAVFNDVDLGIGKTKDNLVSLMVQPQFPLLLTQDWNLIVWSVFLVQSTPPPTPGEERINGFNDTVIRLLMTPSKQRLVRWGLGPAALVPTATRSGLGTGAFGLGGSGIVRYQGSRWTGGVLAQHLVSVHGVVGRQEVQRSLIRPFTAFITSTGLSLGLDSETRIDWEEPKGERWLIPIQATMGQVARIGGQRVNLQIGGRYYVESPVGGPEWGLRLLVTFLFPVEPETPP